MKSSFLPLRKGGRGAALFAALAVAASLGLSPHPAGAQDGDARPLEGDPTVDVLSNGRSQGRINYGAGVVKATGYGAPPTHSDNPAQARLMARGAALADALRTLAMTVSSIQVTSSTRVRNYQTQSDVVETHINALLQSPHIIAESFHGDGTAEVTVELPMYGANSIASVVLPEILPPAAARTAGSVGNEGYAAMAFGAGSDAHGNFIGPSEPAYAMAPPVGRLDGTPWKHPIREPGLTSPSDNGPFTSVLVDCRGLNIESIMSPKLIDTTGREVYGTVHVSADYAIETGIVGYPRSMQDALHTARCGGHPLVVRALRAADPHRFNPVISMEDADRILAANNRDHFLEQTRVIFLVDPIR